MKKKRPGGMMFVSGTLLILIGIIAIVLKSLDRNDFDPNRCLDVCRFGLVTVTICFAVPCSIIGLGLLIMGFLHWRHLLVAHP